jgi:hypothetical protein
MKLTIHRSSCFTAISSPFYTPPHTTAATSLPEHVMSSCKSTRRNIIGSNILRFQSHLCLLIKPQGKDTRCMMKPDLSRDSDSDQQSESSDTYNIHAYYKGQIEEENYTGLETSCNGKLSTPTEHLSMRSLLFYLCFWLSLI